MAVNEEIISVNSFGISANRPKSSAKSIGGCRQ